MVLLGTTVPSRASAQGGKPANSDPGLGLTRVNGLSHNTVFSIVQDGQGFLWIGTSDGLNRYDGYETVVYRHSSLDTTSLSHNTVKAVFEDRHGLLWVGTDGGLDRLDRHTGRFIRYGLQPDTALSHRAAVNQLLEDHAGQLWVGTERGLYRYDRKADSFTVHRHVPDDPGSLANDQIWSLYEGRDQTLWIGIVGGVLHRYDPLLERFVRQPAPQSWTHVTVHIEDATGRLWLSGHSGGARAFEPATGRFHGLPVALSGRRLHAVTRDRNGFYWIGTNDGLLHYDPVTNDPKHLPTDRSRGAYLENNVRTLYQDRAGTLWVGTFSGLYRLDPHAKPFAHLAHDPSEPATLSSNTVMAVLEDAKGLLWVGTLGGGLNRVDRTTATVTRYQQTEGDPASLCHNLIWSLYDDRKGNLWVGTDEGLCALKRHTGGFVRYHVPVDSTENRQPTVNAIREDRHGRIWIATNTGLYRLDPSTGAVRRYVPPSDDTGRPSVTSFLQSLHLDSSGTLWIGTFGGDLFELNIETLALASSSRVRAEFVRHPILIAPGQELVSEGIWSIHEDRSRILWLGSDAGLTRFDPATGTSRHYSRRDGLPGSIVYGILPEDGTGRLWVSTNQGLALLDEQAPAEDRVRVYDSGDGLRNTEFNRRSAFKGADGTLYFGGLKGLTWFDPAAIRDNTYVPPVAITRIDISRRDTTAVVYPFELEKLVLSYRDYTVSFAFVALNFTNPGQNRYAYRLAGFDEQWVEAATRRIAIYTNVPPGDYVFRVKGSNDDGVWNEEGAALAITVTPPFWQMWWFRVLVGAGVALVLLAAHRYRVVRLLEVERLRVRIAGDLHDDIGSNLSSIALLSDMVRSRERLGDRERRYLARISGSARDMVEALRDIVWSIDPDMDGTDNLLRRMKDTAAALLGEIPWTLTGPTNGMTRSLDMETRRHLFLAYKEMLHNVARHARPTEVGIRLTEDNGVVRLDVSDDGVGFDATTRPAAGSGLRNMRDRAARIGGTLDVRSRPGRGTTVSLIVPATVSRGRRGKVDRSRAHQGE